MSNKAWVVVCFVLLGLCSISVRAQEGPLVESWSPKSGSSGSVIYLTGYRFHVGQVDKTKVFVIQKGVEHPARTGGGWWTTNNEYNKPQTLGVIIPNEVGPGAAQVVVESEGRRSAPVEIMITEWNPPKIDSFKPTRGAPGTFVRIEGEGFLVENEIEITDEKGRSIKIDSSGSPDGTIFRVPENTAEGVISIRVGSKQYGKGQYTEPLMFTVTEDPLTVELLTSDTISVAPGQWLDLQISNAEPLARSELTELKFIQAGRTIIVSAPKPYRPHFPVPGALSPGEVQLQLRTSRDGRSSEWSEPQKLVLADKPVAPIVDSLGTVKGQWTSLIAGPDRKKSFTVSPGSEIVMNGLWPVAEASKLKVQLVRAGEIITMSAVEVDEKRNWFGDIKVRLPESSGVGDWRMIVSSELDRTQTELPIAIKVVK